VASCYRGNGSLREGITATFPANGNSDILGNIIGNSANMHTVVGVIGNIGNTRFVGGNVAVSGQINVLGDVAATFYRGNGSLLEGITATLPANGNSDILGNIIGNYANMHNVVGVIGNIGNTRFIGGNVAVSGQINVLGNVVAPFFIGDGSQLSGITTTLPSVANIDIRGNVIGEYANVITVIGNTGNIGNVRIDTNMVTSKTYKIIDDFYITTLTGPTPVINFDVDDSIQYDRTNNTYNFLMGGIIKTTIDNKGNLTASGNIIGKDGIFTGNVIASNNLVGENIIGNFANVITGNIGNTRFVGGNVAVSGQINALGNIVAPFFIGDNRGNVIASGNVTAADGIFSGNVVARRDIRGSNTMTLTCASNANILTVTGTTLDTNGSLIQGTSLRGATSEYSLIRLENAVGKVFEVDGRGRLLSNNATNNDCVDIRSTSSAYTADMLNIQSNIGTSSTYNFINCTTNAGATNTFSVNGRGDINSGLILANTTVNANLFTVQSESGSFSNIAIQAVVPRLSLTEYSFISCRNLNGTLFNINGTGAIEATMAVSQSFLNLKANISSFANVMIAANVSARAASAVYSFLTFDNASGRALEVDGRGAIYANVFFSANGISMFNTASAMTQDMIRLAVPNTAGASAYNFISCKNSVGNVFRVSGLGATYGVGAFNTSGADYAEMFEWEDGNAFEEDRRGRTVVLGNNGTIHIASPLDNPTDVFGVVSVNPSVLGDTMWNEWSGRFLRDKFGAKLSNTVYFLVSVSDENERIRCGINDTAPDGYEKVISSEFIENPKFDPKIHYISREDRPEWGAIGLLGKLRVLPGEIVNPNWKLLKTHKHADGDTLEYLVK